MCCRCRSTWCWGREPLPHAEAARKVALEGWFCVGLGLKWKDYALPYSCVRGVF